MTEQDARALAAKRNAHKSKHLASVWTAQHDSVKGWHVALIEPRPFVPTPVDQDGADDALATSLVGKHSFGAGRLLISMIGPERATAAAQRMITRLTGRSLS